MMTDQQVLDDQVAKWREEVARLNDLIAHATGKVVDPDEVPHLIVFDDADRKPELFIGRAAALARYERISVSWNAHLFVKINSNSRDCQYPNAVLA